jgi:hypothetical protein
MDQESAIQAYLAKYKNPSKLEILGKYIRTPEGRNKIAVSMIHPVKLAVDYLENTRKNWMDIEYPMGTRITEYNWFLAAVPEEEQKADPFPELKDLIDRLKAAIDKVKARSRPIPVR